MTDDEVNKRAQKMAQAKLLAEKTYFSLRRGLNAVRPTRFWKNTDSIILIDWDETLSRVNTFEELFKLKLGAKKGLARYNYYRTLVKNGNCSLSQAAISGHAELVNLGITLHDYQTVFDSIINGGKIRNEILRTVKYLQNHGRKVVLATRSPQAIADLAVAQFGFDLSIGSKEIVNRSGKVVGLAQLVGDANRLTFAHGKSGSEKVREVTKFSRLKDEMRKQGITVKPKNVTILSDGYDDIVAFKKAGCSILLVPQKSGGTQKISQQFGLRDQEVVERDSKEMERELKLRLRFPRVNRARKPVQDRIRVFAARKRGK